MKIYSKGSNIFDYADLTQDYSISGQGVPVQSEGRFATTTPIDVDGLEIVELGIGGELSDSVRVIFATKANNVLIDRQSGLKNGSTIDCTGADELYLAFYLSGGTPLEIADVPDITVNSTWTSIKPKIYSSGDWTETTDKEYSSGSWTPEQRALQIRREELKKIGSIEKD